MNEFSSYICEDVIREARAEMDKEKYFLIPNAYSLEFCDKICSQIDNIDEGIGVEFNYGGTEQRVWSSQKRSSDIKVFFDDANELLSKINNRQCVAGTVLATKISPLNQCDEVSTKNRWHIDSWRSQEKVFLFLNDTSIESGAFEFIPKTNKKSFRIKKALEPGFFFSFNPNWLINRSTSRPYQGIDDRKIERLLTSGYKAMPVVVKAGTVMVVNPSYLIHRPKPCIKGKRYALTSYFDVKIGYKDYQL